MSPTKAYLFVIAEGEIVVWDPSTMESTGTIALPGLEDREGQPLDDSAMDRSASLAIDTQTDEVLDSLTVDCPTLDVTTIDEDNTLYFSNWVFAIPPALINNKPDGCAVRIAANSESIDETWSLSFAASWGTCGSAVPSFDATDWVYAWVKVR